MPAKKSRRISKQNKEIIRRNYNKKIIQLNKLIYELSWYSSEVNLQRKFIQDFFNKQIDYSISIYRKQVKKLQDSSVDDYKFIVERTDRFYQRKYQKLIEMESGNNPEISEEITSFEKNIIDVECNNLRAIINEINQNIKNEEEKFEKETQKWQQDITGKIKEIELKSQKAIDDYLVESKKQYNQHQKEFADRITMLQKANDEELLKIWNENQQADFHIDSTYHHDTNFDKYKDDFKNLMIQHKNKLSEIKGKINDEINKFKEESRFNKEKYSDFEELIANQINEMDQTINNLISLQKSIDDKNNFEILNMKSELDKLKNQNKNIIDEKSKLANNNSVNDESSIEYLIKSLQSKFELFQKKINDEKKSKEAIIESILHEIEEFNNDLENKLSALTTELSSQKIQHKQAIDSCQESFFSEKENIIKLYKDEIDKISSNILLLKNNKDQTNNDYKSKLKNLQSEKDFLISLSQKELIEFDQETENLINQMNNDYFSNKKSLQDEINNQINKDKLDYSNQIAEVEKQNQEKIVNLKKRIENEYQMQVESIMKKSYSKSEFDKIEKSYQDEFEILQKTLNESSVLAPESDLFKNMARVISDLQSELKDHEVIIQSRGRCLKFEWQEKIKKENERFARSPFNDKNIVNPRARDQMKKSIQSKIDDVIRKKNEYLSRSNDYLNQFVQKSYDNEDDEIVRLQIALNQLNKQKNDLVQEALLKKEETIKNQKNQIDQYHSEFCLYKRNLLDKINDQKIEFNSNYKKLNESLISTRQSTNQNELLEINSFQAKLNTINFQFCEEKCQLVAEINQLDNKSTSVSLSSSISSSSSSSSLITQETKDAWTKQRKDLDAQVQCLREQLSSEISKLISQKEEIIKNLDNLCKEKFDKKMKLIKIMSNWSPRSSDAELIVKLEAKLKSVSIQLTNLVNEMKKYKNLCIDQERHISKKFGEIPDVELLQ